MTDLVCVTPQSALYMGKALDDPTVELEAIYGNTDTVSSIEKPTFMRLLDTLRNKYPCMSESHTLDIRRQHVHLKKTGLSEVRATVEGILDIQSYCKTNDLKGIPCHYLHKVPYTDPKNPSVSYRSMKNKDYNYRLNLKRETTLQETDTDVQEFLSGLPDALKYFRYKKRYSFLTEDNLFRIDLTAVKTSDYNFKTKQRQCYLQFMKSGILRSKELYELEIEYVGSQETSGSLKAGTAIDEFLQKVMSKDNKASPSTSVSSSTKNSGVNVFSTGVPVVIQEGIPPIITEESGECEFPEMIPGSQSLPPIRGDPTDDIRYEYWVSSDQEWILSMMQQLGKELSFVSVKHNTTATYQDAPQNSTYIECMIYPQVTQEEQDQFQEIMGSDVFSWPDSYGGRLLIPLSEIQGTPESKLAPFSTEGGHLLVDGKETTKILEVVVDVVLRQLDIHLQSLLCIIHDQPLLVSDTLRLNVLKDYKTLTRQEGSGVKFMGPDPVTMTLHELMPDNPGSILQGYVVTEKADGYRAQLFITKDRHGYLIRKSGKQVLVIDTGWVFKDLKGMWLFDGEYITRDKYGASIELFMIFDVYYAGDGANTYPDHAYTYPWISSPKSHSRSAILFEFKNGLAYESAKHPTLTLGFKTYLQGPKALKRNKKDTSFSNISAMGKMCRKILSTDEALSGYGYSIDGLIFMPMHSPVKSTNDIPVDSISGRWSTNYKWKPPEENTIDFKVRIVKEVYQKKTRDKLTSMIVDGATISCKQVQLIVGYDEKMDDHCDYAWKLLTHQKGSSVKEIFFHPPDETTQIHLCNIPLVDGKLLCSRDNVEIRDEMIVEMSYHPEYPEGSQWRPERERFDKSSPQFFTVANNVWDTIQHPVTKQMIQGHELQSVPSLVDKMSESLEYYVATNESTSDTPLRKFHNWIKQRLITDVCSSLKSKEGVAIMDTSVGRGGDLKKYLGTDGDISFFLGLDISSNIREASKRYYLERMRKPKAMFLQYDTSQPIRTGVGCVGSDKEQEKNKILIDILCRNKKSVPKEYRVIESSYRGLGDKGFQLISSQFSLHYYFKNETTLRGYLQNLKDMCRSGGYFIGTCYDGMKVFQTLQETPILEMKDEYEHQVYKLTKKYDIEDFKYDPHDLDRMFGQEIDVYMNSIGQTITEYLVNFEMLIEIMKEYGFTLATPSLKGKQSGLFDQKDFTYQPGMGGFDQLLQKFGNISSKDGRIKRYHAEALKILSPENKDLYHLSSLNNWFIFQKE